MEYLEKRFPVNGKDYKLYEEIGDGVSATVYRALCVPLNEIVAIKVLDLERCNNDLDGIRREVQTMTLMNHPNLIRAHCSFTHGQSLWVVMPYIAGGSCLHIMKSAYPEGFEEPVIVTVLRETLKALVYLHARGHIHRDVKAGNILIDSNGAVKLADFGVSACMFDGGDRQRPRNTFVGTPCWMAPEVMQQLHGYDFKADIWSFGITALELAHGHAPFSKYPPMKVLLMTLQNAPPGLDYERDKRFSKSFKEMVATCLVKDPKKRPTSEKLLKHPFFKHARTNEYVASTILKGLSPLGDRFRILKAKEADLLLRNKDQYVDEHLSQQEYIRGISAWNFNLEDLRNQAALIQDDDGMVNAEDVDVNRSVKDKLNDVDSSTERPSPERDLDAVLSEDNGMTELQNLESSLASFPIKPLQALKGYFDVGDDDTETSPNEKAADLPNSEIQSTSQPSLVPMLDTLKNGGPNVGRTSSLPHHPEPKKFFSGSLLPDNATFPKKSGDLDRENPQPKNQPERNFSGPLPYLRRKSMNNFSSGDDASEGTVVQHKGRFKVTSAGLSSKDPTSSSLGPVCGSSNRPTSPRLSGVSVLPALQCILQQNESQREEIMKLIKIVEQASGGNHIGSVESVIDGPLQILYSSSKEKELQSQVIHLQQSIGSMVEELQRLKMRNAQLEKQMNTLVKNEGNGSQS